MFADVLLHEALMNEPERFFFVHRRKTGVTALFQRLRESFGTEVVYPTLKDQGNVATVIDVDHLVNQFLVHGNDFRVITGHFPLCTTEVLEVPFTTFTVLRDPVERNLVGIDVVGLQERFDTFCDNLESRFGWNLGLSRFANRTPRVRVPDELRERIMADNHADVALHRFAVGLMNERGSGPAGAADE